MPEYLSPGVYIEEISTGAVPIEGVSTSTAGFVGQTERGPTQPTLVTSFTEFQRWFGSFIDTAISYLPFAVKGFFDNGGLRLYVARVVGANAQVTSLNFNAVAPASTAAPSPTAGPTPSGSAAAGGPPAAAGPSAVAAPPAATRPAAATAAPAPAPPPSANLTVTSIGPGLWGKRIYIRIQPSTMQSPAVTAPDPANAGKVITLIPTQPVGFRLTALYYSAAPPTTDAQGNSFGNDAKGNPINIIDPLDIANLRNPYMRTPDVVEDYDNLRIDPKNPDYALTTINSASQLIQLAVPDGTVAVMPAIINFTNLSGGSDGTTPLLNTDYIGDDGVTNELRRGMAGLDTIDEISLLCVPDEVNFPDQTVTVDIVTRCEMRKDRFAILQFNQGMGNITGAAPIPPIDTSYAAIYLPWIRVYNPITQDYPLIPCGGHMAGIYANTDEERGVHKAPANVEILGMLTTDIDSTRKAIEYSFTKGQHDLLNPRGIDVIRDFRSQGLGIRVYGARTMSTDSQWRYINVRRLFIFIEQSIAQGTQWVVFEPNNDTTWARVNRSITNFLTSVWRSGALMGTKAEDAFFVTVDRTTMTQDDIDNGRLICYIGIAPVKPAEFVIFRISQTTIDTSS